MATLEANTMVQVITALPPEIGVLIRGPHGIGKSAIVKSVAADLGLEVIDVRASTMQEGDVVGYPDLEAIKSTGRSTFALPAWFVAACESPVVLFLDELNRGLIGVLNGMFQIILDRELGNGPDGKPRKLHPGTRVVAAVNAGSEYTVNEMDPALLDRFWTVDLKPTVQEWLSWAGTAGVNSLMVDFIRQHPEHLRPTKEVEPGKVAPTQRSWTRLDVSLKHMGIDLTECGGNPPALLYPTAAGFVGTEAAIALQDFVKNYASVLSAEDVLDRWSKNEDKVKGLAADRALALVEKVKAKATQDDLGKKQIDNLVNFFRALTGEQQMALYNGILGCGNNSNLVPFHKQVSGEIIGIINKAQAVSKK
jgi:hypothetical protein